MAAQTVQGARRVSRTLPRLFQTFPSVQDAPNEAPSNKIPYSVRSLLDRGINVPAKIIFLDYECVLAPGALSEDYQREARRDAKRIQSLKEKGYEFKAVDCRKLFERYNVWRAMLIPQHVVQSIDEGGEGVKRIVELTEENSMTKMKDYISKVFAVLQTGDTGKAQDLANRVQRKAEEFNEIIQQTRRVWEQKQERHSAKLYSLWRSAGAVLAVGALGYVNPSTSWFGGVNDQTFLDATGRYICGAAYQWVSSPKCEEYLQRAERVRLAQQHMIYNMNGALDDVAFEL